MTPNRMIPKDFLKEIAPNNKAWFEKYQSEAKDPSGYYPDVQEFLEFCAHNNDKDISKIDRTDIDSYVTLLQNLNAKSPTINRRLSALSAFRNFLFSYYPENFGEKFLSDLPGHKRPDKNPTEIKALSLVQLSYARKYNRRSAKYEYIFELFFQLGIDKNDLIDGNFPKIRSSLVDEIIKRVPKVNVTESVINSYFSSVTKHLKEQGVYEKSRRNINSYDLASSHKVYFIKCPNCGKVLENLARNWVLSKVKFDEADYQDEYHIVCGQCKGTSK